MSDCGVCLTRGDERAEVWNKSLRKVRKDHKCCECRAVIARGMTCVYVSMLWDGDWYRYYTCSTCAEIREAFSCDGETCGMLWEDFADGGLFAALTTTCFDRLKTPAAKAALQLRWMEWKGLRD